MPVECFIVPSVGTGTKADPYRAAYIHELATKVRAGSIRYSTADERLAIVEADQADLDSVAAESDAFRVWNETNIDSALDLGQVNNWRAFLEAREIPGEFVNVGDTRRQVTRGVVGMFLFSQRMEGRFGEGWKAKYKARGMTLNSTWADFPQALKDELLAVRDDKGWTNAELGVTNISTMREILKAVSDRYENEPIFIASFEI